MNILEYIAFGCLGIFVFRFLCIFVGLLYIKSYSPFTDDSEAGKIGFFIVLQLALIAFAFYGVALIVSALIG